MKKALLIVCVCMLMLCPIIAYAQGFGNRAPEAEAHLLDRMCNPRETLLASFGDVDVHDFCVTPTGRTLVAHSPRNSYRHVTIREIVSAGNIRQIGSFDTPVEFADARFSPKGTYFYTVQLASNPDDGFSCTVREIARLNTTRNFSPFFYHGFTSTSPWSANDRFFLVYAGSYPGEMADAPAGNPARVFDFGTGQERRTFGNAVAFSPDGNRGVSRTEDGFALFNTNDGRIIARTSTQAQGAPTFSSDGRILASLDFAQALVHLWDVTNNRATSTSFGRRLDDVVGAEPTIVFSPDNRVLAINLSRWNETYDDFETQCVIVDVSSTRVLRTINAGQGGLAAYGIQGGMMFFPTGRFLVIGPDVFDYTTGQRLSSLVSEGGLRRDDKAYYTPLYISPDGRTVIIAREVRGHLGWTSHALFQWTFDANPPGQQGQSPPMGAALGELFNQQMQQGLRP